MQEVLNYKHKFHLTPWPKIMLPNMYCGVQSSLISFLGLLIFLPDHWVFLLYWTELIYWLFLRTLHLQFDINTFSLFSSDGISDISHSHITSTLHPFSVNLTRLFLSRSIFLSNFFCQYFSLLFGILDILHPWCWCQKQPLTKIAFLYFFIVISGVPGRSLLWILYRHPSLNNVERTINSGWVFFDLMRDIIQLLFSWLTVSVIFFLTIYESLRSVELSLIRSTLYQYGKGNVEIKPDDKEIQKGNFC